MYKSRWLQDHTNLQNKMCVCVYIYIYIYTKLAYFDHLSKNVNTQIWES